MKKILTLLLLSLTLLTASAEDFDINRVLNYYPDWQRVEFNGKARYEKLPVSLTVKMYMERDSLLQISVRAPLLGEMVRIEADAKSIVMVNKRKRTYCSESMEGLNQLYPGGLADLQSLFMARVIVFGAGELSLQNYSLFETVENGEGGWLLFPDDDSSLGPVEYGWSLYPSGRTQALIVGLPQKEINVEVGYEYKNRGMQMNFDINVKGKKEAAALEFTSVTYGGHPMTATNIANYTRVPIKDFLKSF